MMRPIRVSRLAAPPAQRWLRRKFRELIRKGRFEDIAKISYGWPG
ncbi:MAG TPA: hypothetical protein VMS96_03550 [Terriglobales bacterium]|nr:hypothetical protein [Terriglobales bacterium]